MNEKLHQYKIKLVQEPAIVAAFLNPQAPKKAEPVENKRVVNLVHSTLQRRNLPKPTRNR
uniref:Uncharacterized protein n=1 Tax=Hyaloperonospora arabidopsidis (strain Emoy2) TaxID=559515 RepID=M4B5W9_HYAAE